ncbi:MAG: radical SAM protein [Nanoarchaeota archaeon]|nr:radical SAM protein [Nanoarchaeota archaeon]
MIVYGPVPSWRLGNSLGVDLIEARKGFSKSCTFDCIYCQLGHKGIRKVKPKKMPILRSDIVVLTKRVRETKPDYITFSGQGEPTLNLSLGDAAQKIRKITDVPIAVLTYSSLINLRKVRENLNACDLVIAKIDAGTQSLFKKINRPCKGITITKIIQGLTKIKTKMAVQTLLFSCGRLTNADDKAIKGLIKVYKKINAAKPIRIFLGTAYRPAGSDKVKGVSKDKLKKIALQIRKETGITVVHYEQHDPKSVSRKLGPEELKDNLLELLKRRPCTEKEISTRFSDKDIKGLLSRSVEQKRLKIKDNFYVLR